HLVSCYVADNRAGIRVEHAQAEPEVEPLVEFLDVQPELILSRELRHRHRRTVLARHDGEEAAPEVRTAELSSGRHATHEHRGWRRRGRFSRRCFGWSRRQLT